MRLLPFNKEMVESWHKDFLQLMKAVPRVGSFEQAEAMHRAVNYPRP